MSGPAVLMGCEEAQVGFLQVRAGGEASEDLAATQTDGKESANDHCAPWQKLHKVWPLPFPVLSAAPKPMMTSIMTPILILMSCVLVCHFSL
jgi:hypothetical protein